MKDVANILAVARREFTTRARTRAFQFGTGLLVLGVVAFAFLPLISNLVGGSGQQRIALYVGATDLKRDPVATLDVLLNTPNGAAQPSAKPAYEITRVPDFDAALSDVQAGKYSAALSIERSASGELAFTFYASDINSSGSARVAVILKQAANAVAVSDRLDRLGIAPADQATLFAPPSYTVKSASTGEGAGGAQYMLGFGLTILIFMMIILYGTWIAQSVVEEKSSRVMEVILNAATPFQLLGGKVLGVGALALVQYGAILVAGVAALLLEGPVSERFLGGEAVSIGLPAGLTVGVLALLGVYGVLGFLLYAVLYAAAGSLVSRQEEVQQAIMPMALLSMVGYFIGVYTSTGLLDIRAGWMTVLAQIPFFSPFMMLSRVAAGQAAIWEVPLSVAFLLIGIVGSLWVASRIYAAGVLLYGQRPGLGTIWRLVRAGT